MEKETMSRDEIAEALPRALRLAFHAYEQFLKNEDPKEEAAKAFKVRQEACKMFLAHVEKIIDLIERLKPTGEEAEDIHAMIESARRELERSNNKNMEE